MPFSFLSPGRHPATDGGLHFHVGAGENAATAAEQPAEENHTSKRPAESWTNQSAPGPALIAAFVSLCAGAERLISQEEARRREGRGHRLAGHPGGGEERRPEEGDDRVAAAAGERALRPDDTGRSGGGGRHRATRGLSF